MVGFGKNFPINEYYKDNIIDGITINRTAKWWTAVLLINNPSNKKPFLAVYKWNNRGDIWKVHQKIHINSKTDAEKYISAISELNDKII